MRNLSFGCLFLLSLSVFVGCGGESGPTTVDASAVEGYVQDNPEAVALQEKLDMEAEAEAEGEDE